MWWRSNRQKFFIPAYSENVKSAIYYFKKYDKDKGGSLDLKEYHVRAFAQQLAMLAACSNRLPTLARRLLALAQRSPVLT